MIKMKIYYLNYMVKHLYMSCEQINHTTQNVVYKDCFTSDVYVGLLTYVDSSLN